MPLPPKKKLPKGKQQPKKPFSGHMKSSFEARDPHLKHQQRLGGEPGVILQHDAQPLREMTRPPQSAGAVGMPLSAVARDIMRDVFGNSAAKFPEMKAPGHWVLRAQDRALLHALPGKPPALVPEGDPRLSGVARQDIVGVLSSLRSVGPKRVRTVGLDLLKEVRDDAKGFSLTQLRQVLLERVGGEIRKLLSDPAASPEVKEAVAKHKVEILVSKLRETHRHVLEGQGEEQLHRGFLEDLGKIARGIVQIHLARVAGSSGSR
ncbi:MAG: hypothetical protein ACKVPX_04825 [Myxococcaceae bacterium]